jgi:hypothetical protein
MIKYTVFYLGSLPKHNLSHSKQEGYGTLVLVQQGTGQEYEKSTSTGEQPPGKRLERRLLMDPG